MGTGTTAVVAFALNRHYIGLILAKLRQFAKNRIKNGPYLEELKDKVKANKNQRYGMNYQNKTDYSCVF